MIELGLPQTGVEMGAFYPFILNILIRWHAKHCRVPLNAKMPLVRTDKSYFVAESGGCCPDFESSVHNPLSLPELFLFFLIKSKFLCHDFLTT